MIEHSPHHFRWYVRGPPPSVVRPMTDNQKPTRLQMLRSRDCELLVTSSSVFLFVFQYSNRCIGDNPPARAPAAALHRLGLGRAGQRTGLQPGRKRTFPKYGTR